MIKLKKNWMWLVLVVLLLSTFFVIKKVRKKRPIQYATIEINENRLLEKLENAIPQWIEKQVSQDLSRYQAGINQPMLDASFTEALQKKYEMVRFKTCNGQITYIAEPGMDRSKIFIQSKAAFEKLNEVYPLPDMDFIISFADNADDLPSDVPGPIFIYAKLKVEDRLILLPDFKALAGYSQVREQILKGNERYPWHKKKEIGFWRGSTTGGYFTKENWKSYPRSQLVLQSMAYPDLIDARFTAISQSAEDLPAYLKKLKLHAKWIRKEDHLPYKYLIDVDGNTSAYERCYWELLSNCLLLKQESPYMQWYYGAIEPWKHYIPLKVDLSDIAEKIRWSKSHDEECQVIAQEATDFVHNNLYPEDVLLYLNHAFRSYAVLQKAEGF